MSLVASIPATRTISRRRAVAFVAMLGVAGVFMAASATAGSGDAKYTQNCLVCHGADLQGVEGLGVSLKSSAFVDSKSVAEIVAFIKAGRMPDDPATVSGRPMPGFDWLPETDLEEIAAYVKNGAP